MSSHHLHPCKLYALSRSCEICMATYLRSLVIFFFLPGTHFMQVTIPPSDTYKKIKPPTLSISPSPFQPCRRTVERKLLHQQSGRLLLLALIKKDVDFSCIEVSLLSLLAFPSSVLDRHNFCYLLYTYHLIYSLFTWFSLVQILCYFSDLKNSTLNF